MAKLAEALTVKGKQAREAARLLSKSSTDDKNAALSNIATALKTHEEKILNSNEVDYKSAKASGITEAFLDRLRLDSERLENIADEVRSVIALPDPIGKTIEMHVSSNGLQISKKRVPLGVIGSIYESRPNVTIDMASLCLKSSNAVILRGGSESINTNTTLTTLVQEAIEEAGLPKNAVQFIESSARSLVGQFLKMNEYIDLLIPRGGSDLIRRVAKEATMPVVTGGIGVCHTYVDETADVEKATAIAYNAKVQRPTVCNALDTLLIHSKIAQSYLPVIAKAWSTAGVELRGDDRALSILKSISDLRLRPAQMEDWGMEFLSMTAAVKIVDSLDEALDHIEQFGSGHSEAIVTEDESSAQRFLDEVDAAVVYANASTRFTDGAQLGLGAEVAISTNKIHARGPMGLEALTSYKWIVVGNGQIRS
jgi:glutamate-5-semialdehyde dehydrogenase